MSEVVLVVPRRPDSADALLGCAGQFAGLMQQGRVHVLIIREPIGAGALTPEALMDVADTLLAVQEAEAGRIAALRTAYDAWVAGPAGTRLPARWTEVEGNAGAIVSEMGGRADLIVCAPPANSDPVSHEAFSAALFGTDRPVLVVPPNHAGVIGRRVAIAWRDEKRAMRSVMPALRWVAQAQEVHVFIGVRDDRAPPEIPRVFIEHGVHPELHVLRIGSGPFGQTLLDKAHDLSIDLLIMGAYAHSPLREMLLGGVTRYMLSHADLPVLMRH